MSSPSQTVATAADSPLEIAAALHPVLSVILSRPLIGHLQHLAQRVTDGDFESLVIWGELAHLCLAHLLADPADPQQLLAGLSLLAEDPRQACPIPLRTLVDASGIPRETVRRKLERLASQGHVRKERGGWVIHPQAHPQPPAPT